MQEQIITKSVDKTPTITIDDISYHIKQEVEKFYPKKELFFQKKNIVLPNGDKQIFESLARVPIDDVMHTPFARIGDTILLHYWLSSITKKTTTFPNVIYTRIHDFSLLLPNMDYAATTIAAINSLDFNDKTTLDLGCGSGLLSIIAQKNGAKKTIGVDKGFGMKHSFYIQCDKYNNIDCEFVKGNIKQSKVQKYFRKPPKYLKKIPIDEISIVIANIGPHEHLYGDAHLEAIKTIDYLPNAHTFVAAGYFSLDNKKPGYKEALQELRARGFEKISEFNIDADTSQRRYSFSFIAKR